MQQLNRTIVPDRTAAELDKICTEFFASLKVPEEWKFIKWDVVTDPTENTILSVGKVFRNMRTSGQALMHYKVAFITYPERGAICECAITDFGKYKYNTVITNKTIDELNEYVQRTYS